MVKTVSFLRESKTHLYNGSQSVVTGPVTLASLGNLLKMQILRPTKQKLGVESGDLCRNSPPGEADAHESLRTTVLEGLQ